MLKAEPVLVSDLRKNAEFLHLAVGAIPGLKVGVWRGSRVDVVVVVLRARGGRLSRLKRKGLGVPIRVTKHNSGVISSLFGRGRIRVVGPCSGEDFITGN